MLYSETLSRKFYLLLLCTCEMEEVCVVPQCVCGSQGTPLEEPLSSHFTWVLRIEFMPSGLHGKSFYPIRHFSGSKIKVLIPIFKN